MKVKLAVGSMQCTFHKATNLNKMLEMVDEAADHGANLLVLPESCLTGYLSTITHVHFDQLDDSKSEYYSKWVEAEPVPDGPSVQAMLQKARERNIYVIFGMISRDPEIDSKIYNSAVLVGPDGFVGKYDKVHQPADELHIYYHGTDFPVFKTKIGKIGMLICYDKCIPESARELALGGADIISISNAWAYMKTGSTPEDCQTDTACRLGRIFDIATAAQSQCFVISSNQYGFNGETQYPGNSVIVDPQGQVVATTGVAEGIAYYESEDFRRELYKGKWVFLGLHYLKDRRPNLYKRMLAESPFNNNI